MPYRYLFALCFPLLIVTTATAQTVRFDTNVGNFDLKLNPTGNSNLQGLANNMVRYVNSGRYNKSLINRAVPGFALQMGGFQADSLSLAQLSNLPEVPSFDPVIVDENEDGQVDFDTAGLTNSRGTVSLALSSTNTTEFELDPGTPELNSGSSSFFLNLGDNTSLDVGQTQTFFDEENVGPDGNPIPITVRTGGFIPFAEIVDMTTVDLITSLNRAQLGGSEAVSNIPFYGDGELVVIERAFVLQSENSMEAGGDLSEVGSGLNNSGDSLTTPEPTGLVLALGGMLLASGIRRRT